MNFDTIASLSGVIALIWISIGVYVAARFYPNYSHTQQFCSELGAIGSPTQTLSPMINNYPLGFLFCFFGFYITQIDSAHWTLSAAGWMVIIHGVGTWVAGFFGMDKDPYIETPSMSGNIHAIAGLFMMLSLLTAPILILFNTQIELIPTWFRIVSAALFCIAVFYTMKLASAYKNKGAVGLYQRLSYWTQLVWLALLSLILVW